MTIECATIDWQDDHQGNKIPVCHRFGDVYFSKTSGLEESRYVFLEQNQLSARFAKIIQNDGVFIIAETGFGTGLNFLATCALWQTVADDYPNHTARLQFISTERYPLNGDDLMKALEAWQTTPLLSKWAKRLVAFYPPPIAGCHRRIFDSVILDLWFGDATQTLTELGNSTNTKVDAWFLDGFAPKKNAQMWSDALFCAIKHLSKATTTLATFSAAGEVKRNLVAIGATPKKVKGFGKKREMLTATFEDYDSHPTKPKAKTALVIGAGIAGLSSAYALARRGLSVTIIDKACPLAGSSGNPCALLAPKLYAKNDTKDQLSLISFLYSQAFYRGLDDMAGQGVFCQTGVIDALYPSKKPADVIAHHPKALIQPLHSTQAPIKEGNWALLPLAGQIIPANFARLVLAHQHIDFIQAEVISVAQNRHHAYATSDTHKFVADCLVICAGVNSHSINTKALGTDIYKTRHIRGQVSFCHIDTKMTPWSVKGEGYACLFADQDKKTLLFGASFVRDTSDTTNSDTEQQDNLKKLAQLVEQNALIPDEPTLINRASIRSQTPDYHPMVGAITDKVWLHTALGSKGFCFAPFCAELIASALLSEMPCATTLVAKLSPNRPRLQIPL